MGASKLNRAADSEDANDEGGCKRERVLPPASDRAGKENSPSAAAAGAPPSSPPQQLLPKLMGKVPTPQQNRHGARLNVDGSEGDYMGGLFGAPKGAPKSMNLMQGFGSMPMPIVRQVRGP